MPQLNPGTLETKQCRLTHTQAEYNNADYNKISTLEPVRCQGGPNRSPEAYPFIISRFIDIDKVVRLKV